MKSILGEDYYSLLEVARYSAKSEIVKAYHRLKAAFDPDSLATYSLFSPDEARLIAVRVDEAFRVLIDERKKEVYDRWLEARERGEDPPEPNFPRDAAGDQVAAAALATSGTTEIKPFMPRRPPALRPVPVSASAATAPPQDREPPAAPVMAPAPAPQAQVSSPPPPAGPAVDEERLAALLASDKERDGAWLRNVREARGFTLLAIAEKTKINQMYLRFIEENNYRDLPAAVYLRGFLVQIARFHKLEGPDQLAEAYMTIAERRKKETS